ncbi:MAG: OmpA family protein [Alphaproteobacteria bacterium]|nr:OmpA family protein [Alphaproteobacteria bacterium]
MLAILLSAASGHAAAQQVVQIGGSGGPEVVVNWAALYGPAATAGIVSSPLAVRPAARGRGHALLIPNLGTSAPVLQAVAPRATRPVSPPPAAAVTTTAPPARQAAPTVKTPSPPPAPARTAVPAPARPSKPAKRQTARLTPPPVVVKPAKTAPTAKVAAPPPPTVPKQPAPTTGVKAKTPPPPPPPPPPAVAATAKPAAPKASTIVTAKKAEPAPPPPKAAPAAKQQRLAALPPTGEELLQIRFRPDSSVLTTDEEQRLKDLSAQMKPTQARLQLKAYAEATGNNTSKARRLSLSRALAVRSFLIESGMKSTRIDVRALGIARDGGPPDRVDVLLTD